MKRPLLPEGNLKRTKFKKRDHGSRWMNPGFSIRKLRAFSLFLENRGEERKTRKRASVTSG